MGFNFAVWTIVEWHKNQFTITNKAEYPMLPHLSIIYDPYLPWRKHNYVIKKTNKNIYFEYLDNTCTLQLQE